MSHWLCIFACATQEEKKKRKNNRKEKEMKKKTQEMCMQKEPPKLDQVKNTDGVLHMGPDDSLGYVLKLHPLHGSTVAF